MESVLRLLPFIIKSSNQQAEVCESACFVAWNLAVGSAMAASSWPTKLNEKTLFIATLDERWKKQLEILASQIIFKLNSILGTSLVSRIHISVEPRKIEKFNPSIPFSSTFELDEDFVKSAESIQDPKLREQFLKTVNQCLIHPRNL